MQRSMAAGRLALRLLTSVLVLFAAAHALHAQRFDYIWYFGNGAGIDFSGDTAVSIGGGQTRTAEGVAVATDPRTHSLVFYTDGVNVWDSTHRMIVTSGLTGGRSSTQSALIVPVPGFYRRYYVFTSAEVEGDRNRTAGVRYSIFDFNQAEAIITVNQPLVVPTCEKVTAVGTCTGDSYWIVAHGWNNNTFYSYKLTNQGLNPLPAVSTVGPVLSGASSPAGFLTSSPDGSRLVMASNTGGNYAGVFSFDNATGVVSKEIPLITTTDVYGACFSPDGSKVYTTSIGTGRITQFNLSSDDSATIAGSGTMLYAGIGGTLGAVMPGIDGRVYVAHQGSSTLGVIDYPNVGGLACRYRHNGFYLSSGGECLSGLPNVVVSFGGAASGTLGLGPDPSLCRGQSVQLRATGASRYRWSPATGLSCTDCANPVATPDSTVVYTVIGSVDSICDRNESITVKVGQMLRVVAEGPVSVCPGAEALLVADVDPDAYIQWSAGSDTLACDTCHLLSVYPTRTTLYYLDAWVRGGCRGRDSILVVVDPNGLKVGAAGAGTICSGGAVPISVVAPPGSQVLWNPWQTLDCDTCSTTLARPTSTTMYYVDVFDSTGCRGRDSVLVEVDTVGLPVSASGGTTICPGSAAHLQVSDFLGGLHLRWNPGAGLSCDTCTATEARPAATTLYRVEVWDDGGCRGEDSVLVIVDTTLLVRATGTRQLCSGGQAFLGVDAPPGSRVRWSGPGLVCDTCTTTAARPESSAVYAVEVEDSAGCRGRDTVNVRVKPLASPQISGGGTLCPGDSVLLRAALPSGGRVRWQPGTALACDTCSETAAFPTTTTIYHAVVESADSCYTLDSVTVRVDSNGLPVHLAGPTTLCPEALAQLEVEAPVGAHIRWYSSGAPVPCDTCETNLVQPLATTVYRVECWSDGGCRGADTLVVAVSNTGLAVDAGADAALCSGDTAILVVSTSVSNSSVRWSPFLGLDCDTCRIVHAVPRSSTVYRVEVRNGAGCSGSDSVRVVVLLPQPVPVAGGGEVCRGDSTILIAGVPPGARVRWTPSAGLVCDTCATTVVSPSSTAWYRAEVVGNRCTTPDSVEVRVREPVVVRVELEGGTVRPGTPALVPVRLLGLPPGGSVDTVEVAVRYTPTMLRLRRASGVGQLSGWSVLNEQSVWKQGSYAARFTSPSGRRLTSDGAVIELEFESYYGGDLLASEVGIDSLRLTGLGCTSVLVQSAQVRLDSICWAMMRGVELLPFGSDKIVSMVPNPADREMIVRVNTADEGVIALNAVDAAGASHHLGSRHLVAGEHELLVSVRELASGWYRLVVRSGDRTIGARLLLVVH